MRTRFPLFLENIMGASRGRKISTQVTRRNAQDVSELSTVTDPSFDKMVSTGSTLLDLAISGGIIRGGGIPSGILVEIFGPSGSGKTVLLCELAGGVCRQGGSALFMDPEGRLSPSFARLFDLDMSKIEYSRPDTIPDVFRPVRSWEPSTDDCVNGVFADSLAALSTQMEMEGTDKMGARRAKEFSEELRKTCRTLANKGFLMVCTNQVRQTMNTSPYAEKYKAPGGEAVPFYASLRLRTSSGRKLKEEKTVGGCKHKRVYGIETEITVYKSSIWVPYRTAPVIILFDYGIDDVRANLKYMKDNSGERSYNAITKSFVSLNRAVQHIEDEGLESQLREDVIDLWMEIDRAFQIERVPKKRWR